MALPSVLAHYTNFRTDSKAGARMTRSEPVTYCQRCVGSKLIGIEQPTNESAADALVLDSNKDLSTSALRLIE